MGLLIHIRRVALAMLCTAGVALSAAPAASAQAGPAERTPGELIVRFAADSQSAERSKALNSVGAQDSEALGPPRMRLVELAAAAGVRESVERLEGLQAVSFAEPNYVRTPQEFPDDPLFGQLWGLHNTAQPINSTTGVADADIDAPEAWDIETGDPQTVVAVIDSGVELSHPDLAPQLWANLAEQANGVDDDANGLVDDLRGYDFFDDDPDPHDEDGHGTHVAGTALARGGDGIGVTGVAQRGSIMALRVCGSYEGDGCPDSALIEAITYAGEHGADVVNGSLGGGGSSLAIASAIDAQPQSLFVWAAGNGGADGVGDDNDASVQYPCQADEAPGFDAANSLCVAATNRSDNLAGFSNYGLDAVDLGAPGTTTLSASAQRTFFTDDFATDDFATRWTNDAGDTWARTSEAPLGSFGVTDSPGVNYAPSKTNAVRSQTVNLPAGYGACTVSYLRSIQLAAGDRFQLQALRNGTVGASSQIYTSADNGTKTESFELGHGFDSGGSVRIALVLASDASAEANGVHVDNIAMRCAGTPSQGGYAFLQGTSMATPHVSGAAALLASHQPSATPPELRSALLSAVDPLPALAGRTVTGGRLNARRALEELDPTSTPPPSADPPTQDPSDTSAPQTLIERKPAKRVSKRRVRVFFGASEAAVEFRCKLNSKPYRRCTSPERIRAKPGRNRFSVQAVDAAGNPDPTPAKVRFVYDAG